MPENAFWSAQDPTPHVPTWSDRFRGAMLGGAVGDALGAGVRRWSTTAIQHWFGTGGVVDYLSPFGRRGAGTDLTQLSMFTLDALLQAKATDHGGTRWLPTEVVRANHLRWLYTQGVPWEYAMAPYLGTYPEPCGWLLDRRELFSTRDPGGVAFAGLGDLAGQPPRSEEPVRAPLGNAEVVPSLVWAAPVMAWSESYDFVHAAGAAVANILTDDSDTHGAAGFHADVLSQLMRGGELWDAVSASNLNRLGRAYSNGPFPTSVLRTLYAAMFSTQGGRRPEPATLDAEFDTAGKPGELGIALASVACTDNFADAVLTAVNQSADSSVTGALAGQLAGVIHGPGSIPARWLDELEVREIIETLCTDATEAFEPPPPPPLPKWAQRYVPESRGSLSGPLKLEQSGPLGTGVDGPTPTPYSVASERVEADAGTTAEQVPEAVHGAYQEAEFSPTQLLPAVGVSPVEEPPVEEPPVGSSSAEEFTAGEAFAGESPSESFFAEESPAEKYFAEEPAAESFSVGELADEGSFAGEPPAASLSVEGSPVRSSFTEEFFAESPFAEDPLDESSPAESSPAESSPPSDPFAESPLPAAPPAEAPPVEEPSGEPSAAGPEITFPSFGDSTPPAAPESFESAPTGRSFDAEESSDEEIRSERPDVGSSEQSETPSSVAPEEPAAEEEPEHVAEEPESPAAQPQRSGGGHAVVEDVDTVAPSLTERVLGCFLGGALGDALGADLEFSTAEQIGEKFGPDGPSGLGEAYGVHGAITDETQLTLFTAEGLVRGSLACRTLGRTDPIAELQLSYQRWLHTQGVAWDAAAGTFLSDYPQPDGWLIGVPGLFSSRAPGRTVLGALNHFGRGEQQGTPAEPVNDSKGCGGVMRAAPAALWSSDPAEAFELAARTAALTHGHPSGYLSAGAFAVIVQQAVLGSGLDDGVWLALQVLETWEGHEETSRALEAAVALAEQGMPTPEQLAAELGGGWVGEQALAIAVCATLAAGDDIELALRIAVHHSGDSDSTGAICGNITGALVGIAGLPVGWLAELELRDVVEQVAMDYVAEFGFPAIEEDAQAPVDEDWNDRYPVRTLSTGDDDSAGSDGSVGSDDALDPPTKQLPVIDLELEQPADDTPAEPDPVAVEPPARADTEMIDPDAHQPKPAPRRINSVGPVQWDRPRQDSAQGELP